MANRCSASLIGIASGDRIPNSAMFFIHGANEIAAERLVRPCYSDRYLDGPCKGLDDLTPIIIAARVGDAGMERAVFDDAECPRLLDSPQSIQRPVNCRHGLARSFHCRDRCNLALDHTSHADKIDQPATSAAAPGGTGNSWEADRGVSATARSMAIASRMTERLTLKRCARAFSDGNLAPGTRSWLSICSIIRRAIHCERRPP